MTVETPNRVHASAVCFWEIAALDPVANFVRAGFQSRENFSAISIPAPQTPEQIILDLTTPINRDEAAAFVTPTGSPDFSTNSGISVGPPLTPTGNPVIDDVDDDQVVIADLVPPRRIVGDPIVGAVGDRAFFYVMILAVPPTQES